MSTDKVDDVNEATDLDEKLFKEFLYEGDGSEKNFIAFLGAFRDCPPPLLKTAKDSLLDASANLSGALSDLVTAVTPKKYSEQDYENAMSRLKMRLDDVNGYPDKFSSSAILEQKKKVKEAGDQAKNAMIEAGRKPKESDYSLAMAELGKLEKALTTAQTTIQNHDKEVRVYYKILKANRPRIDAADKIAADPLWNAERTTFRTEKNAIVDAVEKNSARDYKKANQLLTALLSQDGALGKFIAKWQEGIQTKVDAAKKSAKASMALVNGMDEGLIASLKPEQQLDLLETLRTKFATCDDCGEGMTAAEINSAAECKSCHGTNLTMPQKCDECDEPWNGAPCVAKQEYECGANHTQWSSTFPSKCSTENCNDTSFTEVDDCNSTTWAVDDNIHSSSNKELFKARAKIMANMQLDPQFAERDKKKRKELVEKIRQDPEIQKVYTEAEEKWGEWTKAPINEGKLKSFFSTLIKAQCETLGHPWEFGDVTKTVEYEDPATKVKRNVSFDKDTGPVQVMFFDAEPSLFGQCLSHQFPTFIELNKKGNMFHDFKEYVDTIVHENGHAFQGSLVKKMKGEAPYDGDVPGQSPAVKWPDFIKADPELYNQARMFDENFQSYVQNSTFSSTVAEQELSNKAYRHEPVEEHSWTTGRSVSAALLIPPEVRSFESKAGLDNRILFLESVTWAANTVVRTRERHPIYVEEWQGEKFKDMKVELQLGKTKHTVKIKNVVDEYHLKLEFDGSSLKKERVQYQDISDPEVRKLCMKDATKLTIQEQQKIASYASTNGLDVEYTGTNTVLRKKAAKFADAESARLILHAFPTDDARDLKKSV